MTVCRYCHHQFATLDKADVCYHCSDTQLWLSSLHPIDRYHLITEAPYAAIPAESTPRPEGASTTTTIAPRGQRRTPCQEN